MVYKPWSELDPVIRLAPLVVKRSALLVVRQKASTLYIFQKWSFSPEEVKCCVYTVAS